MGRKIIETIMGAVVLGVAAFFLVFAYRNANVGGVSGYPLQAAFASVGGLELGSDVRINGIKVGTVVSQRLDPETYLAVVTMTVDPNIRLPEDTVATIAGDGLLGGKHIRLQPGASQQVLAAGDTITKTRDYQSLEEMVGEIMFLATGSQQGQGSLQ